jgi:hypothetical protein
MPPCFCLPIYRVVANTGNLFQSLSIDDFYFCPAIPNRSSFPQLKSSEVHAGTSVPEHLSEHFLPQGQAVFAGSVSSHQQPSSQTFFNTVKAITSGNLSDLHRHDLRELIQPQGQGRAAR